MKKLFRIGRSTATKLTIVWVFLLPAMSYALPQLNGIAVHNELGKEQFIAAVFMETPSSDTRTVLLSDQDKAIEARILADTIYSRRFNRMWVEGMAINSGARELEQQAQNLAVFSNFMRVKLRKGDILRIERSSKSGTQIFLNGIKLGEIADPKFFDLMLRTWVGPVPLSSDFKDALLAGGNVETSIFQRFRSVRPSQERIAAINAALAPENDPVKPSTEQPTVAVESSSSSSSAKVVQASSKPKSSSSKSQAIASAKASSSSSSSKATQVAVVDPGIMNEEDLFSDESIFDDEEEAFSFTAESLLSEQLYISKLTKWTGNYVKYPKFAVRNEQQGTVRLTVTLARNGKVVDIQFLEKSRYEQLNRAAQKAVQNASPYPVVPDEIKGSNFIFTVPVVFRLQ